MLNYKELIELRQGLSPKENTKERALDKFVRPLITQSFDTIRPDRIHLDSNLYRDLGLDSIDRMELILDIEHAFCISLTDREAGTVRTTDDLCRIVCANIYAPLPAVPQVNKPKILFNFRKIFSDLLAMRQKS